jgi:ribosomal protein S18 acetylase RimI-like enzyme
MNDPWVFGHGEHPPPERAHLFDGGQSIRRFPALGDGDDESLLVPYRLVGKASGGPPALSSRKPCLRPRHKQWYFRYDWGVKERGKKGEVSFTIRPGRRDDADAAARLWMQSAREHTLYDPVYATAPNAEKIMRRFLADFSSSSHSCFFVAERDGEVVGFLSSELREGSPAFEPKTWAAIEDIYVASDQRSLGIGHALFEACRKWAKEKGAVGVSLQVAAGNARARKFYEELGFREVSVYEVKEF